jgi:mycothiol synthase
MNLTIRPANLPDDYPGIARVLTSESPEWPTKAEDLAHEDAARNPQLYWAVFVAEETRQDEKRLVGMVSVASVGHDQLAHHEGKFKLNIRVQPDMQGLGVGSNLYQTVLKHLEPLAPCELYTEVWAAHPRVVRFVTDREFVEVWRRIDLHLDVSHFDFTPYAGLEGRIHGLGLEVKTYAELESEPERLAKLYTLDKALWRDIPYGEEVTNRLLEQFELEEIQATKFIPEACFIALHRSAFVGYSNLTQTGIYFDTDMTGVLPVFRGKGVATLLKLHTIHYAQAHGNRDIWTVTDPVNTAMLALNTKLGFQRVGATIRFLKKLQGLSCLLQNALQPIE